jgi:hypothetical protein
MGKDGVIEDVYPAQDGAWGRAGEPQGGINAERRCVADAVARAQVQEVERLRYGPNA